MLDYNFSLENLRFHLTKKDTLVFYGWYRENNPDRRSLRVCLDAKELELAEHVRRGIEIRQKYLNYQADINEEVVGEVALPKDWKSSSKLTIICVHEAEEKIIRTITVKKLISMQERVDYYLETENLSEGTLTFSGWAMADGEVTFTLKNQKGRELKAQVERYYRKDVMAVYEDAAEGVQAGFKVTQATVSRDIRELKLTKVAGDNGKQKYVVLQKPKSDLYDKYVQVLRTGYLSMDKAQNILVIKTVSGMAMAVATAVDELHINGVVGTIAGDDTVMCAVRDNEEIVRVMEQIKKLV